MFLFGMNLMSEHVKKIAGSKAQMALYKLAGTPVKGMLTGTIVTAFIQSSSATSAMCVSLVECGSLALIKAIPVVLGSILGTGITGWVVAYSSVRFSGVFASLFSASAISCYFALCGIIFKLFIPSKTLKRIGEVFLGFAILMLGIHLISESVLPFNQEPFVLQLLTGVNQPLLLFLFGIVLASLLQSASAAVGILQTFSLAGFMSLGTVLPLLLGIGIGASVPVFIASSGKNAQAKQLSIVYLSVNMLGAVIGGGIYAFLLLGKMVNSASILSAVQIALLNTLYRFVMVILCLPFTAQLERLSRGVIKLIIKPKKVRYD